MAEELVPKGPIKIRPDGDVLVADAPTGYQAYMFRLSGMTWGEVATKMGWGNQPRPGVFAKLEVKHYLDTAATRIDLEQREEVLQLELDRLDKLQTMAWPTEPGDLRAVDAVLRIMALRARLLGLEQNNTNINTGPTTIVVGGHEQDYTGGLRQVIQGEVIEKTG